MELLYTLLLLAAFVLFVLAAARSWRSGTGNGRVVDLVAAGLACWVLVPLLQALRGLV